MQHLDDSVAFRTCIFGGVETGSQIAAKPCDQRIGPEILLHHQIGRASRLETGYPREQQFMQDVLSDPDRGIGPDAVEISLRRDVIRMNGADVAEVVGAGVGSGQIQSPLVDIDRPYAGVRRGHAERQRYWSPPASHVEDVALRRWLRNVAQQNGGPQIQPGGGEDPMGDLHGHGMALQTEAKLVANIARGGDGGEVLVRFPAGRGVLYALILSHCASIHDMASVVPGPGHDPNPGRTRRRRRSYVV